MSGIRPPAAFALDWDRSHAFVRTHVLESLADLGMSAEALEYVSGLRLYLRAPFLATAWVPDRTRRRTLASAVGSHLIGIKLVDDLVDGDRSLERWDLGLGVQLIQKGTRMLASASNPARVLELLDEDFRRVWQGQVREKLRPAGTFDEWCAAAELNAARCLGCYAEAATVAGGSPDLVDAARTFAAAFAILVRIADDLLDYQRGERDGNLAHLLAVGRTSEAEIRTLVEEMRFAASSAARSGPVSHHLSSVAEMYADDVLYRMLPVAAGIEESADPSDRDA